MNEFPILGTLSVLLVFSCTLLAIFLTSIHSKNNLSNRLLAVYFSMYAAHISVFFYANFIELHPTLELLRDQIMFLSSPILYLYLYSSIYSDFKIRKKIHLFHLIPFILAVSIFLPRFYLVDKEKQSLFLENYNQSLEGQSSALLAALVIAFYLFLMFQALTIYRRTLNLNYSNKANFNYRWLLQLTILLSVIFVVSQLKQFYFYLGTDAEILSILRIILTTSVFLFMSWILFQGLYRPQLFRKIDSKHLLISEKLSSPPGLPYTSSEKEDLVEFMEKDKPFMDASLSLNSLAKQLELAPRTLSILINQEFGKHFYDFINDYRINEVLHLLENPEGQDLTIQEIMYRSGFNSKSSFYTEFRKRVKQTPSQYRKQKNQ